MVCGCAVLAFGPGVHSPCESFFLVPPLTTGNLCIDLLVEAKMAQDHRLDDALDKAEEYGLEAVDLMGHMDGYVPCNPSALARESARQAIRALELRGDWPMDWRAS
jgi:hypothetical protein